MVKALFDSNILIDHLNGVAAAREEIKRYDDPAISLITWIEVMCGATAEEAPLARAFLGHFVVLEVTSAVAERTVILRRERRMRTPDAIIWATAQVDGRLLVTRDERAFGLDHPGVRTPYRL